ncbi:MAG: hypothetical protein E6Q34_04865 [Burkholderiaceae bacterium]|nr:MAG: hypothetical protein E6Q34_04865 [Burkholderiaceae bacterium]
MALVTACANHEPAKQSSTSRVETPAVSSTSASRDQPNTPKASKANTLAAYQREIAIAISQKNADKIYVSNPQALLRSVIVIKFAIDAKGMISSRDMLRSNRDKETEATAMQSLLRGQTYPAPPAALVKQGKVELIETWLFNSDGRFQLRTVALPQLGE